VVGVEGATSAADAIVVLFNALAERKQEDAYERITELPVQRLAGTENSMARFVRSMRTVAEHVGRVPSVDEYKQASQELREAGEDVETFARLYAHFKSWPRAKEALALSETTTARRIDARFRYRKVGKVWRYSEENLRDTLLRCVEHYQRPPLVAEFEWWRDRELELARAQGNEDLHLPSSSPYRRRFGSWEAALLHFGFTLDEASARFDHRAEFTNADADRYLPDDLPIAELRDPRVPVQLLLTREQAGRVVDAYRSLPRRSRYVLTARLGLLGDTAPLREVAKPLALHLGRVHQLQALAMSALCQAAAGDGRGRPTPHTLHDDVEAALRALAIPAS
jgi:hypothetical protein